MSIFGKVLGVLGFQSNEEPKPKKKPKEEKTKAAYDLKKQKSQEPAREIDGIRVFYPEEIAEVKDIIKIFKNGDAVIVNFDYCEEVERDKIKAYFYGVCEIANSKFLSINGEKMYILLPEGVEIES